jgi:putative restriction endonuclease
MAGRKWIESELLVALKVYFELEFGQFHQYQPRIIEVSALLNRTPSSLTMKLCNFASLDPAMNGKGLKGASKADRDIMHAFIAEPDAVVAKVEDAFEHLVSTNPDRTENTVMSDSFHQLDEGAMPFLGRAPSQTESVSLRKSRVGQSFFRTAVLSGYHHRCGVCGLNIPNLLVASHIIPWSMDPHLRLRPDNGIALCSIHDKAFDLGFWTLDRQLHIELSYSLKGSESDSVMSYFGKFNGTPLNLPYRFTPNGDCLNWHRENVFLDGKP